MVLGGLALVPLPGPGWLIVILGIAVWASEFEPAARLLELRQARLRAWEQWVSRGPGGSRASSGSGRRSSSARCADLLFLVPGSPGCCQTREAWLDRPAGLDG